MDVIWNLTKMCPWDCAICCVSAIHVCPSTKFHVQQRQKNQRQELRLIEKLSVLEDLCKENFEIDFSGGDPLYFEEDLQVIEQAIQWLPSHKIGISMTGSELSERKLELLKKVGVVEFTIDSLPDINNFARPRGYHLASVIALKKCVEAGVKTRAITVLYPLTMKTSNLQKIYRFLCENEISEWELLRFYPVGRARKYRKITPTSLDYKKIMDFLRSLRGSTKIFFQHSLKILEKEIRCPAVKESIGILPDGQVIACPWAIDLKLQPIDELFSLGKVPEQKLNEILKKARSKPYYQKETDYCRIISYLEKRIK